MKNTLIRFIFLISFCTSAEAKDCSQVNEIKFKYSNLNIVEEKFLHVKKIQKIIGVNDDGLWGNNSQLAYENYISLCESKKSQIVLTEESNQFIYNAEIKDHFSIEKTYEDVPYTKCVIQKVPIYNDISQGSDDIGSFVSGAIIGGIIGKVVTKDDGGAAMGAILGGAIANESQKNDATSEIIGYEQKEFCSEKYKSVESQRKIYSYSTIKFYLNGQNYTTKFIK